MGFAEAEIDEKFRELAAIIKAQSVKRTDELEDMLEKESTYEETGIVSTDTKGCKVIKDENSDND
jgi:hypothetical protein